MRYKTTQIPTLAFLAILGGVLLLELLVSKFVTTWQPNRWLTLGLVRTLEALVVIVVVQGTDDGLGTIGIAPSQWPRGAVRGALWAFGCGMLTLLLFGLAHLMGFFAIAMFRATMPTAVVDRVLFFAIGGLVAPVAEELVFRGVVYGYVRRWGWPLAVIISTALFVWAHFTNGLPFTQLVGGVLFAAAFEIEKNLMVPMIIHSTGNLAIFCLSML